MKKLLTLMLAALFVATAFVGCSGSNTTETMTSSEASSTEVSTEVSAEAESTSPAPITSGTIEVGMISIELTDGWYATDFTQGNEEVKLLNDTVDPTNFGNIGVDFNKIYNSADGERQGAQWWAEAINKNYGGDKEITTYKAENGKEYYLLKADEQQNILFADIDESHYIEIACMFCDFDDCKSQIEKITF